MIGAVHHPGNANFESRGALANRRIVAARTSTFETLAAHQLED
jgi:hypothetical protein